MKLKKLPLTETSLLPDGSHLRPSPEQEAEFLRHKHLGPAHEESEVFGQKPMMGFGGLGRKGHHQTQEYEGLNDEEKNSFWAQMVGQGGNEKRMLKGAHGVPLSGESTVTIMGDRTEGSRLHERAVLRTDHHRDPTSGVQGRPRHRIVQPVGPGYRVL
jgi:hypothetical protein